MIYVKPADRNQPMVVMWFLNGKKPRAGKSIIPRITCRHLDSGGVNILMIHIFISIMLRK